MRADYEARRRSARVISQKASDTSTKTTARNNVASALTSGLTPRRTLENTAIGKVVAEGPAGDKAGNDQIVERPT